jgi:cysteine synthase
LFRAEAFDEIVEIDNSEIPETYRVIREAASKEGLLIGMSSGAILYVALNKAKVIGKGKNIVAVLPDNGLKYLSTDIFEG